MKEFTDRDELDRSRRPNTSSRLSGSEDGYASLSSSQPSNLQLSRRIFPCLTAIGFHSVDGRELSHEHRHPHLPVRTNSA